VVVLPVLLPSIAWCIPHLGVSCVDHNSRKIRAITHNSNCGNSSRNSNSSTISLLHHRSRLHQAAIAVSRQQLSVLQLWKNGPLCSRMPSAQAKQLAASSGTRGQLADGPSERSCTTGELRQLHHRGGDSHGGRSANRYVLPQRTSCYYSVRFWSVT
jgi:hypothetical protein